MVAAAVLRSPRSLTGYGSSPNAGGVSGVHLYRSYLISPHSRPKPRSLMWYGAGSRLGLQHSPLATIHQAAA